jgi:hypothetical protein
MTVTRRTWVLLAVVVVVAALAAGVLLLRRPPPSEVVRGCWSIDYEDMLKTNRNLHLAPDAFEALVSGFTYRISATELRVSFQSAADKAAGCDERFKILTLEDGERALLQVVALATPPLDSDGPCPSFGRYEVPPREAQSSSSNGDADPTKFKPWIGVWAPMDPPYTIELQVADERTLRSPYNFLTRFLWGIHTGPLLLHRVDCPLDQ